MFINEQLLSNLKSFPFWQLSCVCFFSLKKTWIVPILGCLKTLLLLLPSYSDRFAAHTLRVVKNVVSLQSMDYLKQFSHFRLFYSIKGFCESSSETPSSPCTSLSALNTSHSPLDPAAAEPVCRFTAVCNRAKSLHCSGFC